MSLIGSISLGFAQNTMHDFQDTVLNTQWHCLPQMPQKGSPKDHLCQIISEFDKRFQRRRFSENCLENSIGLPWQPEFLTELNFLKKHLKRTSQGTFQPS